MPKKKIIKKKQRQKERTQLVQAIEELKALRNYEHIVQLNQNAEKHPSWKTYNKYINLSLDELHSFLCIGVLDSNWFFGCDKRVRQTAVYSYFICNYDKPFCIKHAAEWINNEAMCMTPLNVKIIESYGIKYPDLLPKDVLNRLPSPWKTLGFYFDHLCELGMLEHSPSLGNWNQKGNHWFKVVSKMPQTSSYKFLVLESAPKLYLLDQ